MMRKGIAGGSYKPLNKESIEKVHQTAVRIIEEVGFKINSEVTLGLFERAGAKVDRQNQLVRARAPGDTGKETYYFTGCY